MRPIWESGAGAWRCTETYVGVLGDCAQQTGKLSQSGSGTNDAGGSVEVDAAKLGKLKGEKYEKQGHAARTTYVPAAGLRANCHEVAWSAHLRDHPEERPAVPRLAMLPSSEKISAGDLKEVHKAADQCGSEKLSEDIYERAEQRAPELGRALQAFRVAQLESKPTREVCTEVLDWVRAERSRKTGATTKTQNYVYHFDSTHKRAKDWYHAPNGWKIDHVVYECRHNGRGPCKGHVHGPWEWKKGDTKFHFNIVSDTGVDAAISFLVTLVPIAP